ncbi:glycosyltransferase family 2 protein [Patescibacteria group bacterium]|nr:glycosyltransferase family 2 protein [Patescibacteria group bacterium]
MNKKIAIIIVNYKDYAQKFLRECRDSLREQNYPKELFQVYIVDNATSSETRSYLKRMYAEAFVVPRDDGNYAAANNAGIKAGRVDGCEYFVIANMDTRFDRNWLSELIMAIDEYDNVGIAQSKILLYPKEGFKEEAKKLTSNVKSFGMSIAKEEYRDHKINSIGNILHFLGFGFTDGYDEADRAIEGYPEIKGYASGCSFIIKKAVLDKIGGYNEEYYMYHDDIEMSLKTRLAGYRISLAPKSVVYHKYEFLRSMKMVYQMERNRYLVMFHFYKLSTILILLPIVVLMDLGMLLYSIVNGWIGAKVDVYKYFLKIGTWRKIKETRETLRAMRKIDDVKFTKDFVAKIDFQEINNPVLEYIANPVMVVYWKIAKKLIR